MLSDALLFGVAQNQESSFLFACYITSIIVATAVLLLRRSFYETHHAFKGNVSLFVSIVCWIIIVVGLIGGLYYSPSNVFPIIFTVIVILIIFLGIVVALGPHNLGWQNALLWSIAISVEKGLPLIPSIEAFARGCTGLTNIRVRKLAKLLESGVPLPDALEAIPKILPQGTLPIIRVGYESGALGKALRQAVQQRDLAVNKMHEDFSGLIVYVITVMLIMSFILTFLFLKIIPSFEKIFMDFGAQMPAITKTFISIAHFVGNEWFILMPIFFLFIYSLYYMGNMPKLLRRRHVALLLDSLALAAENDQPMGKSMAVLAEHYPKASIRRKLYGVEHDVNQGGDWCDSLQRHGMLKQSDHAVLKAAQRVGNLPWAMRELAEINRRRLAYQINVFAQLIYPPIILCLGAVVLFVVVSMFMPVITLIARLS